MGSGQTRGMKAMSDTQDYYVRAQMQLMDALTSLVVARDMDIVVAAEMCMRGMISRLEQHMSERQFSDFLASVAESIARTQTLMKKHGEGK